MVNNSEDNVIMSLDPEPSVTPTPTPTPTPTITPTTTPTPTPTKTPSNKPKKLECGEEGVNECNVVTIFTMGVSCSVIEPSTLTAADGSATLTVTGGTSPYTITWDNGNFGNTITNLSVGSYNAVVVDYYGDFTAYTTCTLVGTMPTPTPTPTPTQTPSSIDYSLCVNITYQDEITSETYYPNGTVNGKQSWTASTSEIVWSSSTNQWFILPSPIGGYILNNNPTSPPTTGWVVLGVPSPQPVTVQVYTGNCETIPILSPLLRQTVVNSQPLKLNVSKSEPLCGCDASISVYAKGGNPPYQYSINGGETYRNIPSFSNLCTGNYTVMVTDSFGNKISDNVFLKKPIGNKTYSVSLNTTSFIITENQTELTKEYTTTIKISPPLENGVILSLDLLHGNVFKSSPNYDSAINICNSNLYINKLPVISYNTTSSSGITTNITPGCQNNTVSIVTTNKIWQNLEITNTDELVVKTLSKVIKNEVKPCYIGLSNELFSVSNLKLKGCNCCNVVGT